MPAYNSSRTISRAIRSVMSQDFPDYELVIVDDCSTDNTIEVVRNICDGYDNIKVICSESNSGGPSHPRNIGLDVASGKYVAFLDSDDVWYGGKLTRQVSFMENNMASISCTGYEVCDDEGNLIGEYKPPGKAHYSDLVKHNTIGCLSVVIDREKVGKFNFPDCGHEDYALWLRLARQGHVVYSLNSILACYTVSPSSVSGNKINVLPFFWNIYRNEEKFSFFKSAFCCLRYAWNVRKKYAAGSGK